MTIDFQPCTPQSCAGLYFRDQLVCAVGCDTSVINLCCWQFLYQSSVAEVEGNYIFRFLFDSHHAYALRFKPQDLPMLLDLVEQDAESHGDKLFVMGVNEDLLHYYEEARPGMLQFNYSLNYSDYVYAREQLSTLAGKKLQSKRNFVNRFHKNYPDFVYKSLEKEDIPACLALDKSWINKGLDLGHTEDEKNERECIKYVFNHWDELRAIGGVLYVDGQLVAFTYGAAIDDTHFDVCVEKADTSFEGAYAVINNEFVKHLPEQYVWINREEDLGIDGLRKAKRSYQPTIQLHKYVVTPRKL